MFFWVIGYRQAYSDVKDRVKQFAVEVVFAAKNVLYELPLLVPT